MECSKKSYIQLFIKNVYGPAITSVPGKVSGVVPNPYHSFTKGC